MQFPLPRVHNFIGNLRPITHNAVHVTGMLKIRECKITLVFFANTRHEDEGHIVASLGFRVTSSKQNLRSQKEIPLKIRLLS